MSSNLTFTDIKEFIKNLVEVPVKFLPSDFFNEKKDKKFKDEKMRALGDYILKAIEQQNSDVHGFKDISKFTNYKLNGCLQFHGL